MCASLACLRHLDDRLLPGLTMVRGGPVHEWLEMAVSFLLVKSEVIVEQEQQLLLHEIDLRYVKDLPVSSPVLVLRGGVVEVLRGHNERG